MVTKLFKLNWLIPVLAFTAVELWIIFSQITGAFFDEGIYATAGLRTLEGYGLSDRYLTWFNGSLLWPLLAGLGYEFAGLVGTRLMALVLSVISMIAVIKAAENLFGKNAGFWTGIVAAGSAPFLAIAHLGVYDLPAITGLGLTVWSATKLVKEDNRLWLVTTAVFLGISAIGKYPSVIMIMPVSLFILAARKEKAVNDLSVLAFILAAIGLIYFLPLREQISSLISMDLEHRPIFGTTRAMITVSLIFYSVTTIILAVIGVRLTDPEKRLPVLGLTSAMFIWPAFHIISGDPVSDQKHIVMGFLFVYPVAGLALKQFWQSKQRWLVPVLMVALTVWAAIQLPLLVFSWPDVRQGTDFLTARVRPNDMLLINNSWPYTMYLYGNRKLESPWTVYDVERISQGENPIALCEFNWFIDEGGSYAWPDEVKNMILACGNFRKVLEYSVPVAGFGNDFQFFYYNVYTAVWQNQK